MWLLLFQSSHETPSSPSLRAHKAGAYPQIPWCYKVDESQWLSLDRTPVHRRIAPQQCWYSFTAEWTVQAIGNEMSCSRTQHGAQIGNRTRYLWSKTLYHWAAMLPYHESPRKMTFYSNRELLELFFGYFYCFEIWMDFFKQFRKLCYQSREHLLLLYGIVK